MQKKWRDVARLVTVAHHWCERATASFGYMSMTL